MMAELRIAIRNVFRNRRRSVITLLSIVSGLSGIIVFGGFVDYTFWGLRESTIRTQIGHIQIYKSGYSKNGVANPSNYLLEDPASIAERVKKMKHVKAVTARLSTAGLVSTGENTLSCKILGVEPNLDNLFSDFEKITEGRPIDNARDGGVLGTELKNSLGVQVGEYATLMTTTSSGMFNALDFQVVGVAQTGSQEYDSVFIKLPLSQVQTLLDTHAVEKLVVLLDKTENVGAFSEELARSIQSNNLDVEYKVWSELAPFYHQVVNIYRGIFNVVNLIVALVIFFSIANTMSMSVFERVREIGTLRALGTSQMGILRIFIFEGLAIGVFGGILGILAGISIGKFINLLGGIPIPPPPGMSRGYQAFITAPMTLILYAFLFSVVVSTLSGILPAIKAARLKIVEALGHV